MKKSILLLSFILYAIYGLAQETMAKKGSTKTAPLSTIAADTLSTISDSMQQSSEENIQSMKSDNLGGESNGVLRPKPKPKPKYKPNPALIPKPKPKANL